MKVMNVERLVREMKQHRETIIHAEREIAEIKRKLEQFESYKLATAKSLVLPPVSQK